ncbi:helix-turn-helix domain-containing protein [Roseivirga seohaensis]|uniref:helix-turn-helix domain-containing protein n=1 Tax=Roseivirga seohaensis TaxID=1914963 RepID=UPI003BAC514A
MDQGDKLRKFLKDKNIKQSHIAEKLGIVRSGVNRILSQKVVPDQYLRAVAEMANITVEELTAKLDSYKEAVDYAHLMEVNSLREELANTKEEVVKYQRLYFELKLKIEEEKNKGLN